MVYFVQIDFRLNNLTHLVKGWHGGLITPDGGDGLHIRPVLADKTVEWFMEFDTFLKYKAIRTGKLKQEFYFSQAKLPKY